MFGVLQCKHLWCICRKLVINCVYVSECEFCHVLQFASSLQQIHQIPIYNCEVHLLVHHCPWLSRCNVQFVRHLLHCSGKVDAGVVCSHFSGRLISWQIGRYDGVALCTLCIGWRQRWRYDGVSICPRPPYHHVSHTRNCWGNGILGNVLLRVTELLPRTTFNLFKLL